MLHERMKNEFLRVKKKNTYARNFTRFYMLVFLVTTVLFLSVRRNSLRPPAVFRLLYDFPAGIFYSFQI